MTTNVLEYDKEFRKLLKCNKLFYRKISKVSQEFYDVYVKKCNEYHAVMGFFEPLYTYLIGYGFSKDKCIKYLGMIKADVISYLREQGKSLAQI